MADNNQPSEAERAWVRDMSALEDERGEFPGTSGALTPHRNRGLAKIPGEFKDWGELEKAIRPEVPKRFLEQLRREIAADNLGSAMHTVWRAVVHDLRTKVVAFGLPHFAALDGMPSLPDEDALRKSVTDHQLLVGCRGLNLLSSEAYVHLSHGRQLVEGFLESDDFAGNVDRLELLNFIKNAIKYCLSVDRPASGFDIQGLVGRIETEELTSRLTDFEAALKSQPAETAGTLIRVLFRRAVEPSLPALAEANIFLMFPIAWRCADEASRTSVAEEFVRVRLSGNNDQANRAWNLLLRPGGARYLPDSMLGRYVTRASQALLDAHNGWNNFSNEGGPARQLRELGSRIPSEARRIYVKAILQSYLGNPHGISNSAIPHVEAMLKEFDSSLVTVLLDVLERDDDITSTLMSEAPASRVRSVIELIRANATSTHDRRIADKYLTMSSKEIRADAVNRTAA